MSGPEPDPYVDVWRPWATRHAGVLMVLRRDAVRLLAAGERAEDIRLGVPRWTEPPKEILGGVLYRFPMVLVDGEPRALLACAVCGEAVPDLDAHLRDHPGVRRAPRLVGLFGSDRPSITFRAEERYVEAYERPADWPERIGDGP